MEFKFINMNLCFDLFVSGMLFIFFFFDLSDKCTSLFRVN